MTEGMYHVNCRASAGFNKADTVLVKGVKPEYRMPVWQDVQMEKKTLLYIYMQKLNACLACS